MNNIGRNLMTLEEMSTFFERQKSIKVNSRKNNLDSSFSI